MPKLFDDCSRAYRQVWMYSYLENTVLVPYNIRFSGNTLNINESLLYDKIGDLGIEILIIQLQLLYRTEEKMKTGFVNFDNQLCVVTGAGSPTGIGFSAAKILGELGGTVILISTTDRIYRRCGELKEMGINADRFIADLMDRDQVKKVVNQIVEKYGDISVLVNNAGMVQIGEEEDFTDFENLTYESWDMSISRNLNLCCNVTKEVLPSMTRNNYGRIVNVSSVTGPIGRNHK